ncbi:MAG TPA: amino acid-binding protein [Rhodospirillales bacterium]|nr:amino acid-binding protein [Rhodospirillales bacterium]
MKTVLVSVFCPDKVGLIAAITGRLFDLGANLSDTTFAVLGGKAEFSSLCELPGDLKDEDVDGDLRDIDLLGDAEISVISFKSTNLNGPSGRVTHHITVSGGDRPGLIARLCEVFIQFEANIMRLNAERFAGTGKEEYVVRIAVNIPEASAQNCLATIGNTAGELGLACVWSET